MGNLHQLLAVKKDLAGRANQIAGETKDVLGKKHLFYGSHKTYQPYEEGDQQVPDELEHLSYTVGEKLKWFAENFSRALDVEYQIELTNREASADVVIDDKVIIEAAPATFLLDLVTALERVRKIYSQIPVLDPKYRWVPASGQVSGVHEIESPEISYKTRKVIQHKVLVDATDKHPAQVEKWQEDKQVGRYTKVINSGALTAAQKADILTRVDKFIEASKKALSEANNKQHYTGTVADRVFDFIHGDLPTDSVLKD